MAIGRAYPIKKSAVKAYGYTKPPKKRASGPRFAANGSVTHIAAINGRGAYRGRTARSRMSGLSQNARHSAARSSLSSAKKAAFARSMRAEKKKSGSRLRSNSSSRLRVKRKSFKANAAGMRFRPSIKKRGTRIPKRAFKGLSGAGLGLHAPSAAAMRRRKTMRATRTADGSIVYVPKRKSKISRRSKPTRRKATRKTPMARKTRRRKKAAARKLPVRRAKRRVKRRKSAKRSAVAPKRRKRRKARKTTARTAPKRKRRRKARKTTLKANPRRRRRSTRRRLKRNSGTRAGALKGWRKRRAKRKTTSKRRRRSRKSSAVAPKRRRRRSRKTTNLRPRKRVRRRKARKTLKANRKRRSSRRRRSLSPNRRRRSSRRRRLSANSRRRRSSPRRRMRRNGRSRRMFRKNGILDPIVFIAKTGGIALLGLLAHKALTNAFVTYGLNKFLGAPAAVVATSPSTTAVQPATSGLGGLSLDPQYQRVLGSFLIAGLGVFASAKVIKNPTTRNTVMTGIGLSFMTTLASALLSKFAPQYSGILAGPSDGTAARLSAMYGFGGTSIQPRYSAISGRGMGEYFESGVNGMGEYFTSGLGEYFTSGVSGLGSLPSYEANAGYGANPDLMEAAAGMGARETMNTNHIDPHGDLDRQLTIAEAAAGVGAYEAAAGFGDISTVPSSSTWIPGMSDGQLWAGTRSISAPQSASEMTPAGILQTDGGQGVFG